MKINGIVKQISPYPYSQERESMVIKVTPIMAKYILDHHNNDNRKMCPSQVNKIGQSVNSFGWMFTGDAIIFNTMLIESQHRLQWIANQDGGEYETTVTSATRFFF